MHNDFSTLAGITAAANDLNLTTKNWGLDFDMEIRPEDGTCRVVLWDKKNGYNIKWDGRCDLEPEHIEETMRQASDWLEGYKLEKVDALQNTIAVISKKLEEMEAAHE